MPCTFDAVGALFAAAKTPPAAALSFQLASVPKPTKSTSVGLAAYVGVPVASAVVELQSATLASVALIAIAPVASGTSPGACPAGIAPPIASWISRYCPVPSVTAGKAVAVKLAPVEAAYCTDQPP